MYWTAQRPRSVWDLVRSARWVSLLSSSLSLSLTLFPFLSAWVWVVDCHFLRCGNLRLLIKKYTHRKHVEGIMRLFCCYCTLPSPFSSPHPPLGISLSLFALLHFQSKWLFLSPLSNGFLLLLYAAWILFRSLICLMTSGGGAKVRWRGETNSSVLAVLFDEFASQKLKCLLQQLKGPSNSKKVFDYSWVSLRSKVFI